MELKVLFVRDDFSFVHCNWNGFIDNDNVSAYSYYTKQANELLVKHPVSKLSAKDVEVLKNGPCESLVAVFKVRDKSQEEENDKDSIYIESFTHMPLTGEFDYTDEFLSTNLFIDLNRIKDYEFEFVELASFKTFADFCDYMLNKENGYDNMLLFSANHMMSNFNKRRSLSCTYEQVEEIGTNSEEFEKTMLNFSAFLDKSLDSALDYMMKSVDDIKALKFSKGDELINTIYKLQYGVDGEINSCMFNTKFKINKSNLDETRSLIKKELDKLKLSWEDWSIAQNIYSISAMVIRMLTMYKSGMLCGAMKGSDVLPDVDDSSIPIIKEAYGVVESDLLTFYRHLTMVQKELDGLNNPEVSIYVDDEVLNILSKDNLNYLNKHLVSGYKDIDEEEYLSPDDIEPYNKFRDCDFRLYSFVDIFKHAFKLRFPVTDEMEARVKGNNDVGAVFRNAKVIQKDSKRYLEIPIDNTYGNRVNVVYTLIKEYKISNGGR